MKSFRAQTHYEVLEISVSATRADVQAAFERLSQLYGDEQVALYGLIDPNRAGQLRVKLKEARDTLIDDQRREAYDVTIGLPPREGPKPKPAIPKPTGPVPSAPAWGNYAYVSAAVPMPPITAPAYTYVSSAPTFVRPVTLDPPAPLMDERARSERQARETAERERAEQQRAEREQAEQQRAEREQAEQQRAERERAEQERAERERAEQQRAERERAEQQRAERERAEQQRAEREQAEQQRAERERAEQQRAERERAEQERAERERAEQERAERERAEQERAERERAEQQRAERERAEAEARARAEHERLELEARERAERERREAEARLEQERQELARREQEAKDAAERALREEQARLEAIKVERERVERELHERAQRERAEAEAQARAERHERERAEREKAERERAEYAELERLEAEEKARKAAPAIEEPSQVELPVLSDDVEVSIIPARATPSREFRVEPKPKPYEVPPDVEFNGDLLRQVRMARGLSLAQLSERTRIGMKHLENVEADRYDALPASVYLRGILMNLARELGLDGLRVAKSYLTFVDAHRSKG